MAEPLRLSLPDAPSPAPDNDDGLEELAKLQELAKRPVRLARVPAQRELLIPAIEIEREERALQAKQFERWLAGKEPSALSARALAIGAAYMGHSRHPDPVKRREECGLDRNGRRYRSHRTMCLHAGLGPTILATDDLAERRRKWQNAMRGYFIGRRELVESLGAIGAWQRFKPQNPALQGCKHGKKGCRCAANRPRRQGLTRDSWMFATAAELREAHAKLLEEQGRARQLRTTRKGERTRAAGVRCPQRSRHASKAAPEHAPDHAPGSSPPAPEGVNLAPAEAPFGLFSDDPGRTLDGVTPDHLDPASRIISTGSVGYLKPTPTLSLRFPGTARKPTQDDSPSAHRPSGPRSTPPAPAPTSPRAAAEGTEPPRATARATPAEAENGFAPRELAAVPSRSEGGGSPSAAPPPVRDEDVAAVLTEHRLRVLRTTLARCPSDSGERRVVAFALTLFPVYELVLAMRGMLRLPYMTPARRPLVTFLGAADVEKLRLRVGHAVHAARELAVEEERKLEQKLADESRKAADAARAATSTAPLPTADVGPVQVVTDAAAIAAHLAEHAPPDLTDRNPAAREELLAQAEVAMLTLRAKRERAGNIGDFDEYVRLADALDKAESLVRSLGGRVPRKDP